MNSTDLNTFKKFFMLALPDFFGSDDNIKVATHRHALLNILFVDGIRVDNGERRRYAFHEKLLKAMKERINFGDIDFLGEHAPGNEFRPRRHKGVEIDHPYGFACSAVPIFTSMEQRGTGDEEFDKITTGQLTRIEGWLTDYAKKQHEILKSFGAAIELWGKETKTEKDHDLYFGFDIEDHKISLTLDKVGLINESVQILRQPVTEEQIATFSEEDQKVIRALMLTMNTMTDETQTFFEVELNNKHLTAFRERIWEQSFALPLQHQTSIVYEASISSPNVDALATAELDKIIEMLKTEEEKIGQRVFMDTNSLITFTKKETGENDIYTGLSIRDIWGTYVRSFGKAVIQKMNTVESVYFRPFITEVQKVEIAEEVASDENYSLEAKSSKRGQTKYTRTVDDAAFTAEDKSVEDSELSPNPVFEVESETEGGEAYSPDDIQS